MRVSPRTAIWPQLVAISLITLGVAGCADSGRFGDLFGSTNTIASRSDQSGSAGQGASVAHIEAKPLPRLASAEDGGSSYGRNAGGYQADAKGAPRTAAAAPDRAPAGSRAP